MVDTKRSLSSLQTLLADNTAGDISAQDVRDFLVSVFHLDSLETSITTTATATLGAMHVCSGTTADYTVTLPTAVGNAGRVIGFRMSNALTKLVTLDGNSTETIDGATTRVMWASESAILISDGAQWCKIAGKTRPLKCSMRKTTDQTISTGTLTLITLDATDVDNLGSLANTGSNRIDFKRPSDYLIIGVVPLFLSAAATRTIAYCEKNASGNVLKQGEMSGSASGATPHPDFVSLVSFAAGDYLQLKCFQNSGSSATADGSVADDAPFLTVVEQPTW